MALATYSDLLTSAANWMAREGDSTLTAVLPDAVAMAEARFNRMLRVAEMEASASITLTSGEGTLPTDYLAYRAVYDSGQQSLPLEYADPMWLQDTYAYSNAGVGQFFTILGSTIKTYPSATGPLTLKYYRTIPALSATNATNWLLTAHPDAYLFATLVEANAFTKDAEASALWEGRLQTVMAAIASADATKRYARVSARPKGYTP